MKKLLLSLSFLTFYLHSNAQNIIADYTFDSGSVNDVSGHGLNGIVRGTLTPTAGQAGIPNTALRFDSAQGYIFIPPDTQLNLTTWSIMAKVKLKSFYSGQCQGNMILEHGHIESADYYELNVTDNRYDGNDCYTFDPTHEGPQCLAAGYETTSSDPTYFIDTDWHTIIGTYNGDTCKTYVDGNLMLYVVWPNQYNYTAFSQPADVYIGMSLDSAIGYPYWFNGTMDRVTIWDGPLSDSDVVHWSNRMDSVTTTVANITSSVHKYRIYPVPATSVLNIPVSGKNRQLQVSISNMYGQQVYRQTLTAGAGNEAKIPISELKSGNYILTIIDDNGRSVEPFTKL